ncbi:MAG: alpha-galactosidase, partial [Vallitaleaceae bacterium]|nr:alpha-galactosidase [Vallitaleaceae bacterium]
WFGKRDDDFSGLGDWQVNEDKLGMPFEKLIEEMKSYGLLFGLWVEPEMISEDSELYRQHPDWVLKVPERNPIRSRYQLVLNLADDEVVDYLYESLSNLLQQYEIDYIKWDFNRSLENVYSQKHRPKEQGMVSHDYILGLYRLLERIHQNFPDLLLESCSGGGGRFDAGMLHYSSQVWLSDNTDAIDRLAIQEGSSYGYPICAMGSHISVVPNHQTGRSVPMETRNIVAMSGSFGYELDLESMKEEEFQQIRGQIARFKNYYDLIHHGHYYRLVTSRQEKEFVAWMFVREDQKEALVNVVFLQSHGNPLTKYLRLQGLDPKQQYIVNENRVISGSQLMYAGIVLPNRSGDYQSVQMHLTSPLY